MKRLAVILGLVLVLFGVSLVHNFIRDDSAHSSTEPQFWLSEMSSWFGSKHHVQPGDVFVACFSSGVFQVTFPIPCHGRIRPSDYAVRDFKLQLVAGSRVEVELHPRGSTGLVLRFPIQGEATFSPSIQVFEAGADLILTCITPPGAAMPCRVQLAA
jgi:hypothetical protein